MSAARTKPLAAIDRMFNNSQLLRSHLRKRDEGKTKDEYDAVMATRALAEAAAAGLADLQAMIDAADRGEVWTVNAGTRLRLEALQVAVVNIGSAP